MLAALVVSPTGADDQTVGLFLNAEGSFDGYTLFSPFEEGNTYLIDNDGRLVHSWNTGLGGRRKLTEPSPPSPVIFLTPYLLEDGSIIGMDTGIKQVG